MNALAKAFGYIATPWINFDFNLGLNLFHPPTVVEFFGQFRNFHLASIVKSHHEFGFFKSIIEPVTEDFHIFYVVRDPRDVMVSYWRFLKHWEWHEGPKTETCAEFIRSQPSGWMMRYQHRQEKTVIHRWVTHADSWTLDIPESVKHRITYVPFRDLLFNYESLIQSFVPIFGEIPRSLERPTLDENTILPHSGQFGERATIWNEDDLELFDRYAGSTMARLGFARRGPMP